MQHLRIEMKAVKRQRNINAWSSPLAIECVRRCRSVWHDACVARNSYSGSCPRSADPLG
jgi:hypothetical protein